MNKSLLLFVLAVTALIPCHLLAQETEIFRQEGIASWYGREFEGRPTASGEIFDSSQLTAAHPALPFGTMLVVTNRHNNRSVIVRVNDRGPFVQARIIDVSRAAAEQLDIITTGTAPVIIESVNRIARSTPAAEAPVVPAVTAVTVIPSITPVVTASATPVIASQPAAVQPVIVPPRQLRLMPEINIAPDRNYRLQVGSYRVARNAVESFERLTNAGLTPSYERFINNENIELYRVVVAGVRGSDVQLTAERISAAGFFEALIREEN